MQTQILPVLHWVYSRWLQKQILKWDHMMSFLKLEFHWQVWMGLHENAVDLCKVVFHVSVKYRKQWFCFYTLTQKHCFLNYKHTWVYNAYMMACLSASSIHENMHTCCSQIGYYCINLTKYSKFEVLLLSLILVN